VPRGKGKSGCRRSGRPPAFQIGRLPVNMRLGAYYNVVKPDNAADWQARFQMQFMFPK